MWEGPQCPESETGSEDRGAKAAPTFIVMGREIIRTKNFVADAANFIVDLAHKALAERKEFRIALSGGNTPRQFPSHLLATNQSRISRRDAIPVRVSSALTKSAEPLRSLSVRLASRLPNRSAEAVQQIHETMAYCILGDTGT